MFKAVIILVLSFSFFTVNAQRERDFQIWNFNSIAVEVAGNTQIYASEKIQYNISQKGINLKFGDVWLKHAISNWFQYAGGFRVLYSRNVSDWVEEQRPMIMGTFSKDVLNFNIEFSQRMEYRMFKYIENHFRYRQRLNIQSPSLTFLGLKLFAAEETFTKFNSDHLHLARLYTGLESSNNKHFAMKFYYVLEKNKKVSNWNTADIVGMNLSFLL